MLDQKAVDKFRLIYEEKFEEPLTPTEARAMAQNLVDLYMKIYAAIPEATLRAMWKEEQSEKMRSLESRGQKVPESDAFQSQTDDVVAEVVAGASPVKAEAESLPSSEALQ